MVSVSVKDFRMEEVPDDSPDTSYLEQEGFEDRLKQYQRDDFGFIGIRAYVDVGIPYGKDKILYPIKSPGLWGIESDSGPDYLDDVFKEECEVLADMLEGLGLKVER